MLLFDTVTKQRAISTEYQCDHNRLRQLFVVVLLWMIHVCTRNVTHIDQKRCTGGANQQKNKKTKTARIYEL